MKKSEIIRQRVKLVVKGKVSSLFFGNIMDSSRLEDLLCEGTVTKLELILWFKEALNEEFPTNE